MGTDESESGYTPFGNNPHYVLASGIDNKGNIKIENPESPSSSEYYKSSDIIGKTTMAISASNKNSKFGKGVTPFVSGQAIEKYLQDKGIWAYDEELNDSDHLDALKKVGSSLYAKTLKKLGIKDLPTPSEAEIGDGTGGSSGSSGTSGSTSGSSGSSGTSGSTSGSSGSSGTSTTGTDPSGNITNITYNNDSITINKNIEGIIEQFKRLNKTQKNSLETLKKIFDRLKKKAEENVNDNFTMEQLLLDESGLEPILMGY